MKRNKSDWRAFLELPYSFPKIQATEARIKIVKGDSGSELVTIKAVNKELATDLFQTKEELEEEKVKKHELSAKLVEEKRKCKNR